MSVEFARIEEKWLEQLREEGAFVLGPDDGRPTYYCLEMFPYPSGDIHMGHVRNYAIGDVVARFKRMRGFRVLHPIGWDAFGLPAENAAMERKTSPREWTEANIRRMREQLERMAFSYDWGQAISTCDPRYYRWGQWLFLKMHERGLVYRRMAEVNWDPVDQTVLANEQVIEGRGWRSGAVVERRKLPQWFFKITDYAEELFEGLDRLEGHWPKSVLTMQRNWIGRSEGFEVVFKLHGDESKATKIFTTRLDTIFGATFVALAFDHGQAKSFVSKDRWVEAESFIERAKATDQNSDYKKEGLFTGSYAEHPFTGAKIPLYLANFVLAGYGTGAVMGVAAHDQRDFEFARDHGLSVRVVIKNPSEGDPLDADAMKKAFSDTGVLVDSGEFTGMTSEAAAAAMAKQLEQRGLGNKKTHYRLKDWLISRQRYWGNPIPMVYRLSSAGEVFADPEPVPEAELPVELPEEVDYEASAGNPLAAAADFKSTTLNGNKALREVETMDTFTCSSWYFMRYMDPWNDSEPFSKKNADAWKRVDLYVGGVEHACLHLLYARFFCKVMRDLGLTSEGEPFKNLLTQGMVCHVSYYTEDGEGQKTYYTEDEVEVTRNDVGDLVGAVHVATGKALKIGRMEKMSKSKRNGISPQSAIELHGSDALRLFVLFAAPPEKDLEWNDNGLEGCSRFLKKVWRWHEAVLERTKKPAASNVDVEADAEGLGRGTKNLRRLLHKTIKKVGEDIEQEQQFNTAIAALMEFLNNAAPHEPTTKQEQTFLREAFLTFIRLLNPFAPLLTEEMNQNFGVEKRLYSSPWPEYNGAYVEETDINLVVQVNGKVRARVLLPATNQEGVELRALCLERAKAHPNLERWLAGKTIVKEVYVPRKLINLVVQ